MCRWKWARAWCRPQQATRKVLTNASRENSTSEKHEHLKLLHGFWVNRLKYRSFKEVTWNRNIKNEHCGLQSMVWSYLIDTEADQKEQHIDDLVSNKFSSKGDHDEHSTTHVDPVFGIKAYNHASQNLQYRYTISCLFKDKNKRLKKNEKEKSWLLQLEINRKVSKTSCAK